MAKMACDSVDNEITTVGNDEIGPQQWRWRQRLAMGVEAAALQWDWR